LVDQDTPHLVRRDRKEVFRLLRLEDYRFQTALNKLHAPNQCLQGMINTLAAHVTGSQPVQL
jgi:hypothetical protein